MSRSDTLLLIVNCSLCHCLLCSIPKIALPILTKLDPSSMAISKSSDIPIDRYFSSSAGKFNCFIWSNISESSLKLSLNFNSSVVKGPTVIKPVSLRFGWLDIYCASLTASSGKTPNLLASRDVLTSITVSYTHLTLPTKRIV